MTAPPPSTQPLRKAAPRRASAGIGRAAVMIGAITVAARLAGFGRQVVFAHSVGATCLGSAYTTANMAPNIVYDIVLGGALSAAVVPVLAAPAGEALAGDPAAAARVRQIASSLLTWTVLALVAVSAVVALVAHPLVAALLGQAGGCARGAMAAAGGRMLVVFAPQVLLYGVAVVLYGIVQAHRRFAGPAVAPLLSSLVVVGTYALFGAVAGAYVNRPGALPASGQYLLAGGTTLGAVAMVAAAAVPAWRLRLGLRPSLRFPPGVAARVRRLAFAGVLTLVAQDAASAAVIVLANRYGGAGTLVIYGFAWAVFVVPYAVLAVPIATSAFPELSARSESDPAPRPARLGASDAPANPAALTASGGSSGPNASAVPDARACPDAFIAPGAPAGLTARSAGPGVRARPSSPPPTSPPPPAEADISGMSPGFAATSAASTRAVLLASWLGVAVLVGARLPLARVFEDDSAPSAAMLAASMAAFAPGLIGYGLSAHLSRVLYAHGRNRAPALAVALGWVLVIAADIAAVPFVPPAWVVPALGAGTSLGLSVAGAALLLLLRRERGPAALAGTGRAFGAGLAGCAVGVAAGWAASWLVAGGGFAANAAITVGVSALIALVFAAVVWNTDGGDLRAFLTRLRARVRSRRPA